MPKTSEESDGVDLSAQGRDSQSLVSESSRGNTTEDLEAEHRRAMMRKELARMQEKDDNEKLRQRAKLAKEKKDAKEAMRRKKFEKGITILPDSLRSKQAIHQVIRGEEKISLRDQQRVIRADTNRMKADIDRKLGISSVPKGDKLVSLAKEFYSSERMTNAHLPEHIQRELTSEEIGDFRVIFEMFDAKNKGYITAEDLKRAAGMLGYTAKKRVFREMIDDSSKGRHGRVTFVNFLDLMVRLQGDGSDPFQELQRGFRLLDQGDKGYLNFSDIKTAAEQLQLPLSNRAIREMMAEADITGDGKISFGEFSRVVTKTDRFKAIE